MEVYLFAGPLFSSIGQFFHLILLGILSVFSQDDWSLEKLTYALTFEGFLVLEDGGHAFSFIEFIKIGVQSAFYVYSAVEMGEILVLN